MDHFLSLLPVNAERRFSMLPALLNGSSALTNTARPINRLSALFDHFFNDNLFAPLTLAQTWTARPLSLWQDEHNVYVEMDTPGVTDKDIDLSLNDGDLIIRGERKCERKDDRYDSRTYGQFEQRVSLPAPVESDKVEAKLTNGVLSVRLPKNPEAKPRKIAIKSE
jgi:HSP20 family protein